MATDDPGLPPSAEPLPLSPGPPVSAPPAEPVPDFPDSLSPAPPAALEPGSPTGVQAPAPAGNSLARRILLLPPVRILVALAFVIIPQIPVSYLSRQTRQGDLVWLLPSILLVHLSYVAFVRWVERRPASELALRDATRGLAFGMLIGAGLIAAVTGVLWALGYYRVTQVTGIEGLAALLPAFTLSAQSGYFEEVISRGIVFRIAEDGLGTWLSVAFSALLFGFLHALNPAATLLSSVSIAASAGVLLAGIYALTRRLWPVIGLHFAWNFTEGGIFGIPVSGFPMKGLLRPQIAGPEVLTGGAFGIEASVLVLTAGLLLGAWFLAQAVRAGRIVPPFWGRPRPTPAPSPAVAPLPPPGA